MLALDFHHSGLLVREAHFAFLIKTNLLQIVDEFEVINTRLQDDRLRTQISEEAMVHQRSEPEDNSVRATKFLFANKDVNSPIVIIDPVKKTAKGIFLDPIDFKITKWLPIPASNNRETMPARQIVQEKLLLNGLWSTNLPHCFDAGVVHPSV